MWGRNLAAVALLLACGSGEPNRLLKVECGGGMPLLRTDGRWVVKSAIEVRRHTVSRTVIFNEPPGTEELIDADPDELWELARPLLEVDAPPPPEGMPPDGTACDILVMEGWRTRRFRSPPASDRRLERVLQRVRPLLPH